MRKLNYKEYLPTRVKIDSNGCWIWQYTKSEKGYGVMYIYKPGRPRGVRTKAHRLSYEIFKGPIPAGKYVCHSCDVRSCINPDHLWIGTHQENMNDAYSKSRIPNKKYNNRHDGT